ncbi:hypothetical protein CYMTET_43861, partial [Cymbomonas tetramitiformis]
MASHRNFVRHATNNSIDDLPLFDEVARTSVVDDDFLLTSTDSFLGRSEFEEIGLGISSSSNAMLSLTDTFSESEEWLVPASPRTLAQTSAGSNLPRLSAAKARVQNPPHGGIRSSLSSGPQISSPLSIDGGDDSANNNMPFTGFNISPRVGVESEQASD